MSLLTAANGNTAHVSEDTPFGSLAWARTTYGDAEVEQSFMNIFGGGGEPTKSKRPVEIALACLERAEVGTLAGHTDFAGYSKASTAFSRFIRYVEWSQGITGFIIGMGYSRFLRDIALHIIGTTIDEHSPAFKRIDRAVMSEIIVPVVGATLEAQPTESANPDKAIPAHTWALIAKRNQDAYAAVVIKAQEIGSTMAELFLAKASLHNDELIAATVLDKAMDQVYNEWTSKAFELMQGLATQGALLELIKGAASQYHELTLLRRKNETQARVQFLRAVNADSVLITAHFRDKSDHRPIRTKIVNAYKFMAYEVSGSEVTPVASNNDINEMLFDLTLPRREEAAEWDVNASGAYASVAALAGTRYYTDHVERLVAGDTWGGAAAEVLDFAVDAPKGLEHELFSMSQITKATTATPAETLTMLQNRSLYTVADMTLLGNRYSFDGLGSVEYARFFAAQVLGSLIPKSSDTGKVDIVASDMAFAPSRTTDLLSLIKEAKIEQSRTLIARVAEHGFNHKTLLSDDTVTVIGCDLLLYYWKIAKLLGFDKIKAAFRAVSGNSYTLQAIAEVKALPLIMSWTSAPALNVRLRPLGLGTDRTTLNACIAIESFINKIGNDKVVRAFMQALSLYLVVDTDTVTADDIPDVWASFLN